MAEVENKGALPPPGNFQKSKFYAFYEESPWLKAYLNFIYNNSTRAFSFGNRLMASVVLAPVALLVYTVAAVATVLGAFSFLLAATPFSIFKGFKSLFGKSQQAPEVRELKSAEEHPLLEPEEPEEIKGKEIAPAETLSQTESISYSESTDSLSDDLSEVSLSCDDDAETKLYPAPDALPIEEAQDTSLVMEDDSKVVEDAPRLNSAEVQENPAPSPEPVVSQSTDWFHQFKQNNAREKKKAPALDEYQGNTVPNPQTTRTTKAIGVFATSECTQQIIQAINGENTDKFVTKELPAEPIPSNIGTQQVLNELEQRMQVLEQMKHPNPPWTYKRLEPENKNEKVIIKIDYDPNYKITEKDIKHKKIVSLATRKLSIIGGVLTMLDSSGFITNDPAAKDQIRKHLVALSNDIIEEARLGTPRKTSMNTFINNLNADIAKKANIKSEQQIKKEILRPIRKAERYFVAEHNQNRVLMVVTHKKNGTKVIQIDNEFNHELTAEQKNEYMKIHNKNKQPDWFQRLRPEEKDWYLQRIPTPTDSAAEEKWIKFSTFFKSSAMQHTPGLSNARANYLLLQKNDSSIKTISASIKSGTPVSYEMQKDNRESQSLLNVEQLLEKSIQLAKFNSESLWGDFFQDEPRPPTVILFQSLLSEKNLSGQADQFLIDSQREAIDKVVARHANDSSIEILYHNNATNSLRHPKFGQESSADQEILRQKSREFVRHVFDIIDKRTPLSENGKALIQKFCDNKKPLTREEREMLISMINSNRYGLNQDQRQNLVIMVAVEEKFRLLNNAPTKLLGADRRNKEEYKIALKKMMVEAMGGVETNNCKSGKDRTGQSAAYQHALSLIAEAQNGEIPAYDATGAEREALCDEAAELNSSMMIQEAAAMNTPGSVGTKAPVIADIIDAQFIRNNFKTLHPVGCDLAGLNKCKTHKSDEESEQAQVKALDKKGSPRQEVSYGKALPG